MRKKLGIVFIIIVVVLLGTVGLVRLLNSAEDISSFSIDDFRDEIVEHPSDLFLGEVTTAKEMKEKALSVLKNVYGFDVYFRFPFRVYFDEENQVWLMRGSFFFQESGPCILISKADGKVLAVWDYKF